MKNIFRHSAVAIFLGILLFQLHALADSTNESTTSSVKNLISTAITKTTDALQRKKTPVEIFEEKLKGSQLDAVTLANVLRLSDPVDAAKLLNAWIHATISYRPPSQTGSIFSLNEFAGVCGDRDIIMHEVAQKMGYEARRVNFFEVPIQIAHTTTEIKINGKWLWFDSSFGVYYAKPDAPSVPISIAEARESYPDVVLMRARGEYATGRPAPLKEFEYSEIKIDEPIYINNTPMLYPTQTYIRSKMTSDNKDDVYNERVYISLDKSPSGLLGKQDGKWNDLIGYFNTGYGDGYYPFLGFIGNYTENGPYVSHDYTFLSDKPKNIKLKLSFTSKPDGITTQVLHSTAAAFSIENYSVNIVDKDKAIDIDLRVMPPATTVHVSLEKENGRASLDSIHWSTTFPTRTPFNQ